MLVSAPAAEPSTLEAGRHTREEGRDQLLRRVDRFSPAQGVPEWWEPLLRTTGNVSVFLTAAWLQTWLEAYATEFSGYWIRWEVENAIVGGCLLLRRVDWIRALPIRTLSLNATAEFARPAPYAEYNDVVHLPAFRDAIAADLGQFVSTLGWTRLQLNGYESGSVAHAIAASTPGSRVERKVSPARYIRLDELDPSKTFVESLKGKAGTYVRRNHRWYQDRLGALQVRRAEDLASAQRMFEELRRLHVDRFTRRHESTSLADDTVVAFHHRLITRLWPEGAIDLLRIGNDREAVGYLYNFVAGHKVFVFQTGFAYEAHSKWSPGLLAHACAIDFYRRAGLAEYDFLSGDALYKRTLCNRSRDLYWSHLYPDRWHAHALLAARRVAKALKAEPNVTAPPAKPSPTVLAAPLPKTIRQGDGPSPAPLVSIVIPSYNSAGTLAQTLDSALAQTYPALEVIVVDDGSTDGTPAVLERYADRITVVRQANGGLASARNAGCRAANGQFIALLDADDLCRPDRVTLQVTFMQQVPDVLLCCSEFSAFDASGRVAERDAARYYSRLGRVPEGPRSFYDQAYELEGNGSAARVAAYAGTVYPSIAFGSIIHPPTVMFRREAWSRCGPFDESIRNACDWEWFVRVARAGKIGYIDEPLLDYRYSPTQLSGQLHKPQVYRDVLSNLQRFVRNDAALAGPQMRRCLGEAHLNVAEAMATSDGPLALRHLAGAAARGVVNAQWVKTMAKSLAPTRVLQLLRVDMGNEPARRKVGSS